MPEHPFVVCGTGALQPELAAQYGALPHISFLGHLPRAELEARIRAARVVVVPNGVDDQAIHPIPRDEALAASLGATGDLVVGYVSNLDHPREGQEVLVEAVALLRERGLAVTAVLVGGGERREELTRLAHARGVGDHVVLTGVVPHERVADYYALRAAQPQRWQAGMRKLQRKLG